MYYLFEAMINYLLNTFIIVYYAQGELIPLLPFNGDERWVVLSNPSQIQMTGSTSHLMQFSPFCSPSHLAIGFGFAGHKGI